MKQELNYVEIQRENYHWPVRYQPTASISLQERKAVIDDLTYQIRCLEISLEQPNIHLPSVLEMLTNIQTQVLHTYLVFGLQKVATAAFKLSHIAAMQTHNAGVKLPSNTPKVYRQPWSPPDYKKLIENDKPANPFRI